MMTIGAEKSQSRLSARQGIAASKAGRDQNARPVTISIDAFFSSKPQRVLIPKSPSPQFSIPTHRALHFLHRLRGLQLRQIRDRAAAGRITRKGFLNRRRDPQHQPIPPARPHHL